MTYSRPNASAATLAKNRTKDSVSPFSGMCTTCIEGCPGLCEIGKAAFRGQETLYPQPFGTTTSASQKDYPIDYSHFNILGTAVGAEGIEADSDKAIFPNANLETRIGKDKGIKLKLPFVIPGIGSTDVAHNNWEGLAIGAALTGTMLTIGENVVGMDPKAVIKDNRVVSAPDLKKRVKQFQDWQLDGCGAIVAQENVEDIRLGVLEYAISELGVEVVELKWGQGAKDIGGEVKIKSLEKAQMLQRRGYIVLPDPENPSVIESFKRGSFKEFERHSRVGMVDFKSFIKRVEELRSAGARYITLKTGAYRPADLARAVKFASEAKLDYLTVDGAGGGTGMSPWRMMNEWGVPMVELHSLTHEYCKMLDKEGKHVPDIALAGGFTLEDQIYKGLALGAPYTKLIGMARSPIAAAMVGKNIGENIEKGKLPTSVENYGSTIEDIFVTAHDLKNELGEETFHKVPPAALGVCSYYRRLEQGLKQLMCGNRKFALEHVTREDICSLTREASEVSGITYVMDTDKEEAHKIIKCEEEQLLEAVN